MKGDILNAVGCCLGSKGDMFFDAVGDIIETCKLELPYPSGRIDIYRNQYEVALNNYAIAKAEKEAALKDWQNCKSRVFCYAKPKENILDSKEAAQSVAETALQAAETALQYAERANSEEQLRYNTCIEQQKDLQAQQAEIDANLLPLQTEQVKIQTAATEAKTDMMTYGLIGAGALTVLVIGYLMLKK